MASTRSLLACPPCEAGPFTRNHFFTGKLLVERDFTDEQRYFIDKLRHHHQRLHGYGVVCGLRVKPHPNPACRDRFVCVEPGAAVDCCGREIVVREEECIDLTAYPEVEALFERDDDSPRHTLRLSICYRECPTEEVPVLYDECACDDTHCAPNRILESFRFTVEVDPPEEPPADAPGVELAHVHTLAVSQAHRVAYDGNRERVYVLSRGGPATLTAFRAANHSLVRSTGLGPSDEPLDLAVSADGERVYLAARATGATHPLQVRVLDADLVQVNVLTLPEDAGRAVHLAAAPDGRLYALNASNRKLYAWDDPDTDGAGERQELATVGDEPSALAVDPDGARAFAAAAGGASVTVLHASSGSTETLALPAGARPVSLAAAGGAGAERLLVGDGNGRLHVHGIRPGEAEPFPALGSVDLPGAPVALIASRGGRWVFALLEGTDGAGSVQVVDAHAVEAGSGGGDPLGASVAVEDRPRSLAIADDGRRLYAAAEGPEPADGAEAGGGVAVLDVTRTDCADVFLRSLDGCPECAEECLTLATITEWTPGQDFTEDNIDNLAHRRLLPSTTEIVEVLRCLLDRECDCEGGAGEPGPPGAGIDEVQATIVECTQSGSASIQTIGGRRTLVLEIPRGCDGQDGQDGRDGRDGVDGAPGRDGRDGVGLEEGLTRIRALSWRHRAPDGQLLPIRHPSGGLLNLPGTQVPLVGLVIGFTDEVRVNEGASPFGMIFDPQRKPAPLIDFDHVFQVLTTHRPDTQLPLLCRCMLRGDVVPVDFKTDPADPGLIDEATALIDAAGNLAEFAPGAAFVFNPREVHPELLQGLVRELWVSLRGDFVLNRSGEAADVEFARAELPSGDRPSGSDHGVQGGVFDSWFGLNPEQPLRPLGSFNTIERRELVALTGVDEDTARALEAERESRPFESLDDVESRVRLPDEVWEWARNLITVRREEG